VFLLLLLHLLPSNVKSDVFFSAAAAPNKFAEFGVIYM
jgi:hypothetical protein